MPFAYAAVSADAELDDLQDEWLDLFRRSETSNPFVHPAWVEAWLQFFVADARDRIVVTARREGQLVAVAPFYRRVYRLGPIRVRCLQVAGSSPTNDDPLTEMSEILTLKEGRRRILRSVLHHVALEHMGDSDWIGLTLSPEQGWFDDDWLPDSWRQRGAFAVHKDTRPYVVLPLPPTWEELALKRNMKEAIRRSRNRLAALDPPAEIVFAEGDAAETAAARIQDLHRLRASLHGHFDHDNYFDDKATAEFARRAVAGLAATGHATATLLQVGDEPIAGRVVLRAGRGAFLSFSGADPAHWALGAPTSIIVACIRRAMEQGGNLLNFSLNPDAAKLRWSEQLELHNEFLVVGPSKRSQRLFTLFWHVRANRSLARHRHIAAQRYSSAQRETDETADLAQPDVRRPAEEAAGSSPRFSIVCLSSLDWDAELPTNRQQIMRRAAQRGHQVLFVETGAFLGVQLLRLLRGPGRLSLLRRLVTAEEVAPGVRARRAVNLMPWGQRYQLSNRLNGWISSMVVRRHARRLPGPRVVWLYDPRGTWAIGRSDDAFAVYDCVDDYAEQATGARNRALIAAADRESAERARVVFATTRPLEERHRLVNEHTYLVPNVGDFGHFNVAVDRSACRADLASLPRPVYGFAGNLLPGKVDLDLLEEFGEQVSGGTLLLAGPTRGLAAEHMTRLTALAHVHAIGPVPYDEMPSVVAAFDVALIPYAENEYTRSCFPLKLYEYLAAGKPAVATGLPELRGMEPDVVVADDLHGFIAAVARALELVTPADVERRVALAAKNTWDGRTTRLLELVAAQL